MCFNAGGEEDATGHVPVSFCKPDVASCGTITADVLQRCQEAITRRSEKEVAIRSNQGLDEEDKEALMAQLAEEEDLLQVLVDILCQMIKMHGPALMPMVDTAIAPAFATYLNPKQPVPLQIAAVCLLDDVIEFGGAASGKYVSQLLPYLVNNLTSTNNVLCQCSAYGLAAAVRSQPSICSASVSVVAPALLALIASPKMQDDDCIGCLDNAVFALGSMCVNSTYQAAFGAHIQTAVNAYLSHLPLTADERQAKTAHRELCTAIESGDVCILGESLSNIPEILRVFADVLIHEDQRSKAQTNASAVPSDEDEDDETLCIAHFVTLQRIRAIVKSLVANQDPICSQVCNQAFSALDSEQQSALSSAASS
jgi:hypothetical protein